MCSSTVLDCSSEERMIPNARHRKAARSLRQFTVLAVILLCTVLAAIQLCKRSQTAQAQTRAVFSARSTSFLDGGSIPRRYTCDGADLSPQVQWQSAPASTKSFAIVMDDPDAPIDFTHWLVWNIPPGVRELAEGASRQGVMPSGSAEGTNDFGRLGYGGPCPPPGMPHHYMFRVYALDRVLNLPSGATPKQLGAAMVHHIVGWGTIAATYQRAGQ